MSTALEYEICPRCGQHCEGYMLGTDKDVVFSHHHWIAGTWVQMEKRIVP